MALTTRQERLGLAGLHGYTWVVVFVMALTLLYAGLQIAFVRPYLWPGGTGAAIAGDPSGAMPLIARPPDVETERGAGCDGAACFDGESRRRGRNPAG